MKEVSKYTFTVIIIREDTGCQDRPFLAKRQAFEHDLQEEKLLLQKIKKTHWLTFGGWIPKIEVQIIDGQIKHEKWYGRDSDGQDIEMNGPLAFVMQLSCGPPSRKKDYQRE